MQTMQGCLLILKSLHGNPGWVPRCCYQFVTLTWGKMGKGLLFLTPSSRFPSSLLVFSYLQHQFACQGSWQVKILPDYWNPDVKRNWIHLLAICSEAGAGQIQMRGRWGRRWQGWGDKEGQRGGSSARSVGCCWGWGAWSLCSQDCWKMSSDVLRKGWLLALLFCYPDSRRLRVLCLLETGADGREVSWEVSVYVLGTKWRCHIVRQTCRTSEFSILFFRRL